MNRNLLKLLSCIAWAGVAISSASSVDARALTAQYAEAGDYAVVTADFDYDYVECDAGVFMYVQTIKFVSPGRSPKHDARYEPVYTNQLYSTGRKAVSGGYEVCFGWRIFDLGTCAC
jgi:hypothetical protein